jgi:hypothetical protein
MVLDIATSLCANQKTAIQIIEICILQITHNFLPLILNIDSLARINIMALENGTPKNNFMLQD